MRIVLIIFCCVLTVAAHGSEQPARFNSAVPFSYDPVFWKESLHLSTRQLISIEQINSDFYFSVKSVAGQAKENRKMLLNKFLLDRNERIWNIFSKRQQSKWRRITVRLSGS